MKRPERLLLPALVSALTVTLALGFSSPASAQTESGFLRGDSNADGDVDIADAVKTLMYLFKGEEIPCLDAADVDVNGSIELTDPIALLGYIFLGSMPPDSPFPVCGPAPEGKPSLGCETPQCLPQLPGVEPVWMWLPDLCRQCEPCPTTLADIVAYLESTGIQVFDSKYMSPWAVCLACGCPTGKFYCVLVSEEDAEILAAMGVGWSSDPKPGGTW